MPEPEAGAIRPTDPATASRHASSRRFRRPPRRVLAALLVIAVVLAIGTVGFHLLEGVGYLNAFYFECMLATGQGPPFPLTTDGGKLFASLMAFVSVGSVVTTLVFVLGPLFGRLWREGIEKAEEEARKLERRLEHHDPRAKPPP